MGSRMISTCDECGKEGKYNGNYLKPNDWVGVEFRCNNRSVKHDFCSKECLIKYISSDALGNDVGHEIKIDAVEKNCAGDKE